MTGPFDLALENEIPGGARNDGTLRFGVGGRDSRRSLE